MNPFSNKRSLVVGAINIDRFYRVRSLEPYRKQPWWPRAGETLLKPELREGVELLIKAEAATAIHVGGGGQAANFSIAAAACGVEVTLFGTVGVDPAASIALADLGDANLGLVQRTGRTTEAYIFVDPAGERDILILASDAELLPPTTKLTNNSDFQHAHFTSLPSIRDVERQRRVFNLLPNTIFSLDIGALYANLGHEPFACLLGRLDVLFATQQELELFTRRPLDTAIEFLLDHNVKAICCKHGAGGSVLYDSDGRSVRTQAPLVDAIDTTGAGDVFAGVFVGASLRGATKPKALRLATDFASKSVSMWGRAAYPTKSEFVAALHAQHNLRS